MTIAKGSGSGPGGVDCLRCKMPGHCCKGFRLNHAFNIGSPIGIIELFLKDQGLPFIPNHRSDIDDAGKKEFWTFNCSKLSPEGRCTIYEDRPDICKEFVAGSNQLCYHVLESVVLEGGKDKPIVPMLRKRVAI